MLSSALASLTTALSSTTVPGVPVDSGGPLNLATVPSGDVNAVSPAGSSGVHSSVCCPAGCECIVEVPGDGSYIIGETSSAIGAGGLSGVATKVIGSVKSSGGSPVADVVVLATSSTSSVRPTVVSSYSVTGLALAVVTIVVGTTVLTSGLTYALLATTGSVTVLGLSPVS